MCEKREITLYRAKKKSITASLNLIRTLPPRAGPRRVALGGGGETAS